MAIKELGFSNVKIYNGGLKDWGRSGYPLEQKEPLESYRGTYITPMELWETMEAGEESGCMDSEGQPRVTVIDYRTENFLDHERPLARIRTGCPTVFLLLDDLLDPEKRNQVPKTGMVVFMSETGNRDWAALAYLAKYGYTNVVGLSDGMRGWLKAGLPVDRE